MKVRGGGHTLGGEVLVGGSEVRDGMTTPRSFGSPRDLTTPLPFPVASLGLR